MTEIARGEWLSYEIRRKYARWRKDVRELTFALTLDPDFKDAEDLGDFVEMVSTLMSFAPEPGPRGDNEFPELVGGGERMSTYDPPQDQPQEPVPGEEEQPDQDEVDQPADQPPAQPPDN